MTPIVLGNKYLEALCKQLGLDARHVSRIVIDIQAGEVTRIYPVLLGDDRLVDVVALGVTEAEVIVRLTPGSWWPSSSPSSGSGGAS